MRQQQLSPASPTQLQIGPAQPKYKFKSCCTSQAKQQLQVSCECSCQDSPCLYALEFPWVMPVTIVIPCFVQSQSADRAPPAMGPCVIVPSRVIHVWTSVKCRVRDNGVIPRRLCSRVALSTESSNMLGRHRGCCEQYAHAHVATARAVRVCTCHRCESDSVCSILPVQPSKMPTAPATAAAAVAVKLTQHQQASRKAPDRDCGMSTVTC